MKRIIGALAIVVAVVSGTVAFTFLRSPDAASTTLTAVPLEETSAGARHQGAGSSRNRSASDRG
jgi:protein required for attachment to host cells